MAYLNHKVVVTIQAPPGNTATECAASNFLLSPLSKEPAPSREQIRVLAGPYTENPNCLGSRVFLRGCPSGAKCFRTVAIHSGLCPLNRCSLLPDTRQTAHLVRWRQPITGAGMPLSPA